MKSAETRKVVVDQTLSRMKWPPMEATAEGSILTGVRISLEKDTTRHLVDLWFLQPIIGEMKLERHPHYNRQKPRIFGWLVEMRW